MAFSARAEGEAECPVHFGSICIGLQLNQVCYNSMQLEKRPGEAGCGKINRTQGQARCGVIAPRIAPKIRQFFGVGMERKKKKRGGKGEGKGKEKETGKEKRKEK